MKIKSFFLRCNQTCQIYLQEAELESQILVLLERLVQWLYNVSSNTGLSNVNCSKVAQKSTSLFYILVVFVL